MRWVAGICVMVLVLAVQQAYAGPYKRYAVYYSDQLNIDVFDNYEVLIFDGEVHPPLRPLADRDKLLLGYLSLMEIDRMRSYFEELKQQNVILGQHPQWQNSYYVDVRSRIWIEKVINEIIPDILRRGFHGLFIDTLDNAADLEKKDPETYKGMKAAAIKLVKAIRLHYPGAKLMINRGYDILPELANDIDMVMAESMYSRFDFDALEYGKQSDSNYDYVLNLLKDFKEQNPKIHVFTLDYWKRDDVEAIRAIYEKQRSHGFVPYVGEVLLNDVIAEPRIKKSVNN